MVWYGLHLCTLVHKVQTNVGLDLINESVTKLLSQIGLIEV
jgi:hypothetical protein